jgi:hypothetical protein
MNIWMDVDTALSEVPVNVMPLIDDTDFKSIEASVAYNATGMALKWNFVTTAGAYTQTAVTPTTGGVYDWTSQGNGMYSIEIPASGGASINNNTEGFGWFSGVATGVLPWRGPVIGFRAAALNNSLVDGTTIDVNVTAMATDTITAAALKADAVTEIQNGLATPTNITAGTITTVTNVTNDVGITQAGADKVWGSTTRTLSSFGTLVSDIWANATRTLTAGVATAQQVWEYATRALTDKADFALSSTASADLVDAIWDEELTGATHNVATSSGRRIRTMDSNVILSDVLPSQAGLATNAIKFDGGASSADNAYDPAMIVILDGDGAGQCRLIYQYNGTTKTAYVDRDWKVQPAATDTFAIIADPGREHINEGLAQAGGADTITLNANASDSDDAYVGQVVVLKGGTGSDQASHIIAYNGTTKVATVNKNWAVQPDNTTTYVMLPTGMLYLAGLVSDIWSAGTRTLTQAAIAPQASISAGNLIGVRGDTISLSVTGLGSLANYSALYFTAKTGFGLPDAESTLQIVKKPGGSDGLLWLNAAATTSSWGSITITDANAGDITIALTADASKELAVNLYNYDIQIVRSAGTPVSTLATGRLSIIEDVTRSIS